jgi:5'-3' exonuclease
MYKRDLLFMGIPTFFRKIVNQYPNVHYWKPNEQISHLFIDFNCLIYQAYRLLPDKNNSSSSNLESNLIKNVIQYLSKICNELTHPTKLMFLSFDGTVPRAKMIEQRKRRYKSLKLEAFEKQLYEKLPSSNISKPIGNSTDNSKTSVPKWSPSIHIVPGSRFMTNLSEALSKEIAKQTFKVPKVILSDASVPGEGEQKFISYIRKHITPTDLAMGEKICLYGLDADLIVLALTTQMSSKTIILREAQDSPIEVEKYGQIGYLYLSPHEYLLAMFENLRINNSYLSKFEFKRLVIDYTFITFLAGNDFIRRINFLKIREKGGGGIDLMVSVYKNLLEKYNNYLINDDYKINFTFFTEFIKILSEKEADTLRELQKGKQGQLMGEERQFKEKEKELNPIELAMEKFQHSSYDNPINPEYNKYGAIMKKIDYFQSNDIWRKAYYQILFHVDITEEPQYINVICQEYLKSLNFTLSYYMTSTPPDWSWYYPFEAAPLAIDLKGYLETKSVGNLQRNSDIKSVGKPYKPFEQLMMILPSASAAENLPSSYVKLMADSNSPLLPYYPIDFQLGVVLGGKFIYAEPLLPRIDEDKVLRAIEKIKLTAEEEKRNRISNSNKINKIDKSSKSKSSKNESNRSSSTKKKTNKNIDK